MADPNLGKIVCGYYLEKHIGEGTYSKIYKAYDVDGNRKVCVKAVIAIPDTKKHTKSIEAVLTEIDIYKAINSGCPNIIQYYSDFIFQGNIYVVIEHGKCDLYDVITKGNVALDDQDKMSITRQMANTVLFLHSKNIIHRDIKPENVIVFKDKTVKLCDFGLSIMYDKRNPPTDCTGSPEYLPPEVIKCSRSPAPYNHTVDMWCLGLLIYELYIGKTPFYDLKPKELTINILMYNDSITYPQGKVPPMAVCRFLRDLIRYWPSDRQIVLSSLDE